MKRHMLKRSVSFMLAASMAVGAALTAGAYEGHAAKKAKVTPSRMSLEAGQKKNITIKNRKKGAKYTFKTASKKIAKVNVKGVVTAVKEGNTAITVNEQSKVGGKKKNIKIASCIIQSVESR